MMREVVQRSGLHHQADLVGIKQCRIVELTWYERVNMPRGEKAEDLALYAVKSYKFQQIISMKLAFSLVNFAGGFRPTESIRFLAMSRCSCVKNQDGLVVEGRSGMTR